MQIEITPEYLASQGLSPTFAERFWSKVDKNGPVPERYPELGPCWLWTGARFTQGYGGIRKAGKGSRTIKAHTASWILNVGPPPNGLCICHHCDVTPCCNYWHLFAGTHKDNSQDCVNKGRYKVRNGERSNLHILNPEQVVEIRKIYSLGILPYSKIGVEFGVSVGAIGAIVRGDTWGHLNKQCPCIAVEEPAPYAI